MIQGDQVSIGGNLNLDQHQEPGRVVDRAGSQRDDPIVVRAAVDPNVIFAFINGIAVVVSALIRAVVLIPRADPFKELFIAADLRQVR